MSFMDLDPETKLCILRKLPLKDVLSCRLVTKDFVPRDIVTLISVMQSSCDVSIILDLSPKPREEYSLLQADVKGDNRWQDDVVVHENAHEFQLGEEDGTPVPDYLLQKAKGIFLVGVSPSVADFVVVDLTTQTGQVRNISSMLLFNLEILAPLYHKNKDTLQGICTMELPTTPDDDGISPPVGFIDCRNLTCCHRLQDVVILGTEFRNLESLPTTLTQLIVTSNLTLQQAEWVSQNMLQLRVVMFGLDTAEFEKHADLHPRVNGVFQNGVSMTQARAFMVPFSSTKEPPCTCRKLQNILAETLDLFDRTQGVYVEFKKAPKDQEDDEDDNAPRKPKAVANVQVFVDRGKFQGFPV